MPDVFGALLPATANCESPPSPPPDGALGSCVGPDGVTDLAAPYGVGTVCALTCAGDKVPSQELRCVDANIWSSVLCVGESVATTLPRILS